MSEKLKLDIKKTILIGFGFMSTSIVWAIYDPYITTILEDVLSKSPMIGQWNTFLMEKFPALLKFSQAQQGDGAFSLIPLFIGLIMTFDNVFGVIFQPTFGKLSDRCRSKYGKRRPFIFFGAPISAVLFALIPIIYLNFNSLALLMATIILFVLSMSLWRAPVVALMPDLTPSELRSEGNAIINLCGGVGTFIGMVAGMALGFIFDLTRGKGNYVESEGYPYIFALGSIIILIAVVVLRFFVHEPDSRLKAVAHNRAAEFKEKEAKAEKERIKAIKLSKGERKSLVFMLAGLFFLFCGSNAVTTFFALFSAEILHKKAFAATLLMAVFAVCSMIAAVPAGKFGKKFGRKKTIIAGLAAFLAVFVIFFSVLLVTIGQQSMKLSDYVSVNNSYSTVSDQLVEYNSELTKQADKDGVKLTEDETLNIDKYIEFRTLKDAGADVSSFNKVYSEFDATISEDTINRVNEISARYFDDETSFGKSLGALKASVTSVTGVLNVIIIPVLILAGFANMFITVNTLPLVLEIGGVEKVGTFTGYYYTATFSAQIAAPIAFGIFRMFSGTYSSLFIFSPIAFALSLLCIIFVKHGEAIPDDMIKEAEMSDD